MNNRMWKTVAVACGLIVCGALLVSQIVFADHHEKGKLSWAGDIRTETFSTRAVAYWKTTAQLDEFMPDGTLRLPAHCLRLPAGTGGCGAHRAYQRSRLPQLIRVATRTSTSQIAATLCDNIESKRKSGSLQS